jgi:hypothetical protein
MQNNEHAIDCIKELAKIKVLEVHGQVSTSLKAILNGEDYEVVHHAKHLCKAFSNGY